MQLVGDLIEIIGYYTVPDVTLNLLVCADRHLPLRAYTFVFWRAKCEVVRKGVIDANTNGTPWYHVYRTCNLNHYGTLRGEWITGMDVGYNGKNRVYAGTANYLYHNDNKLHCIVGPRIVKSVSINKDPNHWVCLDERGTMHILITSYDSIALNVPVIDIKKTDAETVTTLTRNGDIIRVRSDLYINNVSDEDRFVVLWSNQTWLTRTPNYFMSHLTIGGGW